MDVTRAAANTYLESWNELGMDWPGWMAEVASAKAEFAGLINTNPNNIAVTTATISRFILFSPRNVTWLHFLE